MSNEPRFGRTIRDGPGRMPRLGTAPHGGDRGDEGENRCRQGSPSEFSLRRRAWRHQRRIRAFRTLDQPRWPGDDRQVVLVRAGASPTRAFAVLAPGPAAGPALAFYQLLLGPADAARSRRPLFRILDPTDELIACQGGDVLPGRERRGARGQRVTQISRELVHHPTGHALAGHEESRSPSRLRVKHFGSSMGLGVVG